MNQTTGAITIAACNCCTKTAFGANITSHAGRFNVTQSIHAITVINVRLDIACFAFHCLPVQFAFGIFARFYCVYLFRYWNIIKGVIHNTFFKFRFIFGKSFPNILKCIGCLFFDMFTNTPHTFADCSRYFFRCCHVYHGGRRNYIVPCIERIINDILCKFARTINSTSDRIGYRII